MAKVWKWKIDKLKEHPHRAALFGDFSEEELADLTEQMERNGLDYPVEVLPDGTIIRGHERVRAAKSLGWEKIDVVVLHDLNRFGDDEAIVDALKPDPYYGSADIVNAFERLVYCLRRVQDVLDKQGDKIGDTRLGNCRDTLNRGLRLLGQLARRAGRAKRSRKRPVIRDIADIRDLPGGR
jgi:hypothetical protein